MNNQNLKEVTFKMRKGKKIEMASYSLWCLLLSAFGIWSTLGNIDHWPFPFMLFMVFLNLFPITGIVFFASTMLRSSLTLSEEGLIFKGGFTSKRQVFWQEVKGFYENVGDVYLKIRTLSGKPEFGIPISWFAKMQPGKKPYPFDNVLESLLAFAPHLFNFHPSD